jgi:hypothetical protein
MRRASTPSRWTTESSTARGRGLQAGRSGAGSPGRLPLGTGTDARGSVRRRLRTAFAEVPSSWKRHGSNGMQQTAARRCAFRSEIRHSRTQITEAANPAAGALLIRKRSLVRVQDRPPKKAPLRRGFSLPTARTLDDGQRIGKRLARQAAGPSDMRAGGGRAAQLRFSRALR